MNPNVYALLITILVGIAVFAVLIPEAGRTSRTWHDIPLGRFTRRSLRFFKRELARNGELGGYVHDTAMCQFIPPNTFHCVTGTWTFTAGPTAGTISAHKAAAGETTTVNIPIIIPSNSVSGKGSMLKYVELDYVIGTSAATSCTLSIAKVAIAADGSVPVVSAPAGTQLLTAATTAADVHTHRDRFTLTTPVYIADTEQYLLKLVAVCAAGTVLDLLGARAYFTERL